MAANELLTKHDDTFDRLVRQEEFILDVTERSRNPCRSPGVTKAELAKRLKRSPRLRVPSVRRRKKPDTQNDFGHRYRTILRPTLKLSSVPKPLL